MYVVCPLCCVLRGEAVFINVVTGNATLGILVRLVIRSLSLQDWMRAVEGLTILEMKEVCIIPAVQMMSSSVGMCSLWPSFIMCFAAIDFH